MYKNIRVIRILFLGFSSGLPILLIFSTLSLWLKSGGIERSIIKLFSWAGLAYSFKFLWAPLLDHIAISSFSKKIGHRKFWLASIQIFLIFLLLCCCFIDPAKNLTLLALIILFIGIASAYQDIIIDAYRIESAHKKMQHAMSSPYIIGYRLGMIVAGAGSLLVASYFGTDNSVHNPLS